MLNEQRKAHTALTFFQHFLNSVCIFVKVVWALVKWKWWNNFNAFIILMTQWLLPEKSFIWIIPCEFFFGTLHIFFAILSLALFFLIITTFLCMLLLKQTFLHHGITVHLAMSREMCGKIWAQRTNCLISLRDSLKNANTMATSQWRGE